MNVGRFAEESGFGASCWPADEKHRIFAALQTFVDDDTSYKRKEVRHDKEDEAQEGRQEQALLTPVLTIEATSGSIDVLVLEKPGVSAKVRALAARMVFF